MSELEAGLRKLASKLRVLGYEQRRYLKQELESLALMADGYADVAGQVVGTDAAAMAENGNETEEVWMAEYQRVFGPDATLSGEAQSRLHQLRMGRYAVSVKGSGGAALGVEA